MVLEDLFDIKKANLIVAGTGLIALDVIINNDAKNNPQLMAGGSCGNVLTILSYLGWNSYPIAGLGDDEASKTLIKDIRKWDVDTSLLTQDSVGNTPIIVEIIRKNSNGEPIHRFTWRCPNCGSFLPKYRPVLLKNVSTIIKKMPTPHVFYFDRVSRSSIELAKANKKKGALVFFEPCGIKDKKQFLECLHLSSIVKYSHKNMSQAKKISNKVDIPLIIETFGAEGLRYHLKKRRSKKARWKSLQPHPINRLIDTAGAGDWCSAGIIHLLGREGAKNFERANETVIDKALSFGQVIAALSCQFEGARGIMYSFSNTDFQSLVWNTLEKKRAFESIEEKISKKVTAKMTSLCPKCNR